MRSRNGRFRQDERIGAGANATVWRGWDRELDRPVAIKRPHPHLTDDPDTRQRLVREARNGARLHHPNIVEVYEVGDDGDGPWVVMELVDGEPLSDRIRREGPMPAGQVAAAGRQIAAALAHAHERSIVHRDVKPGNVLIDASGHVWVVDFGLARHAADPTLTATGLIAGTPSYLAPEVGEGGDPSPAADVYALGAVLYEMLAGAPPFTGTNPIATVMAHRSGDPPPLAADPPVPVALERLVRRCLAKDPSERPAAHLVAVALGELAGDEATRVLGADPAPTAVMADDAAVPAAGAGGRRVPTWAVAGVLGALAVLVGALALATRDDDPAGTRSTAVRGNPPAQTSSTTSGAGPATAPTTTSPATAPADPATPDPLGEVTGLIAAAAASGAIDEERAGSLRDSVQSAADAHADGDDEDARDELRELLEDATSGRLGRSPEGQALAQAVTRLAASWGIPLDAPRGKKPKAGRGPGKSNGSGDGDD